MKNGILYASMTGHSKKIAEAVGTAHGIEVFNLKDNPKLEGYDQIFVVSGIYGGKGKPELLDYLKNWTTANTGKVVLMTSSMTNLPQTELREAFESSGIGVHDKEFLCKGSFLVMGLTHPNKTDLQEAVSFVEQVLKG